ncbi:MAG: tetratricopeptide repeat protein [Thermoplasmata archaeon]
MPFLGLVGGVATANIVCKKCGTENEQDAVSCINCGNPFEKEGNSDFEEIEELNDVQVKPEENKGTEFAFEEIVDDKKDEISDKVADEKKATLEEDNIAFEELVDETEKSSNEAVLQTVTESKASSQSVSIVEEQSKSKTKPETKPEMELRALTKSEIPKISIKEEIPKSKKEEANKVENRDDMQAKRIEQIKAMELKPKGAALPVELSKKVDRVMIFSAIVAIICHFVGAREVAVDWYMRYVYKMKFPFPTFSYDATIRLILLSIVFIWGIYVYNKVRIEISNTEKRNMNMVLIGVVLILLGPALFIPLESINPDLPISYYILPWPIFNSLILLIGIIIVGAYVLWSKEEGGGVFTWLIGVFILFVLPIHRMFHFAELEVWQLQTYDQIIGAVGEGLIAVSFVMVRRRRGMANDGKRAYELGNALYASGRYAEAIDAYDDAIQIYHNLYAHRLDTYISKGIIDVPEEYVMAWVSKGATLARLGKFRKALAHYDIALSIDPNNKIALNLRGESLLKLNRLDEARECFERALEIDGEYKDAERNLIEVENMLVQNEREKVGLEVNKNTTIL